MLRHLIFLHSRCLRSLRIRSYSRQSGLSLSDPRVERYLESHRKDSSNLPHPLRLIIEEILSKKGELNELASLAKDAELRELAEKDSEKVKLDLHNITDKFFDALLQNEDGIEGGKSTVVLEVSAGVGGQEAMLFTQELFEMYNKFSICERWESFVMNSDNTEIGGLRHASLSITGEGVYDLLKFEGGVHRVQRVPKTEKGGRVHTSTAAVAVLFAPSETQILISPQDLKIETKRSSGAGGQHVNKTESAVRLTHIPSGIVVDCQTQRSQIQNRSSAMQILRARLHEREEETKRAKVTTARKLQVGTSGRSEKVRTYNYTQDRVTDHRISSTSHNIRGFLDGGPPLKNLLIELQEYERDERISSFFEQYMKSSNHKLKSGN